MTDDRDAELERLEKELLAESDPEDDLLADLPVQLLESDSIFEEPNEILPEEEMTIPPEANAEQEEVFFPEEPEEVTSPCKFGNYEGKFMRKTNKKSTKSHQKREDKWLIGLMIAASFLCVGILGVMIYWMEVFFK